MSTAEAFNVICLSGLCIMLWLRWFTLRDLVRFFGNYKAWVFPRLLIGAFVASVSLIIYVFYLCLRGA